MGLHRNKRTILKIKNLDYQYLKNRERLQQFRQPQNNPFPVPNRKRRNRSEAPANSATASTNDPDNQ